MLEQEGYDLMGAAFEVYNAIGHGFLEDVYQECLESEPGRRNISFKSQHELTLHYKGGPLRKKYVPDYMVSDDIFAARKLLPEHEAQLINYLKAAGKRVGYLINFGSVHELEWKRIIIQIGED